MQVNNAFVVSRIFEESLVSYTKGERLIINKGGTRSGKTYSILQLLFIIANVSKKPLIISVVSDALPHLRLGSIRDFEKILNAAGVKVDSIRNKTENTYKIGKSIIEFFGTENLGKVHGPARDILFINECNNIKNYEIFRHLSVRTRKAIFLDYNPVREFWLHDEIVGKRYYKLIVSTYKDNRFLTPEQITEIELNQHNKNWWRVYGLGLDGMVEGCIFTNWSEHVFDENLPFVFGLDFGFSSDPDALVKVAIDNGRKQLFLQELLYKNGLGSDSLYDILKTHCNNDLIIADCAEDRLISDFYRKGLNIRQSVKGPGSIKQGIKIMLNYQLIIAPGSHNLRKELNNYMWADKRSETPIDSFNHLIDAARYALYYNHIRGKAITV